MHAHFHHAAGGRIEWEALNAARLRAGARMGIDVPVASILGSWGRTTPVYFPSPRDVTAGNDAMLALCRVHGPLVRMYVTVNPNDCAHALAEIERCVAQGAIGVKLAASRRADDPLLDPIAEAAGAAGLPVLHHIWQDRRRDWPGQEASDGAELGMLAARHPRTSFICAHIGGGGDYRHSFAALRGQSNVFLDLSGSGVDRGMLDGAVEAVGAERLLWGCDITMETGLAKLWALDQLGLGADELRAIRYGNAVRIFPRGAFPEVAAGFFPRAVEPA